MIVDLTSSRILAAGLAGFRGLARVSLSGMTGWPAEWDETE
jgi:hypothetical protein